VDDNPQNHAPNHAPNHTQNHAKSWIRVKNHPFPVLLYLEWGLLAIGLLTVLALSLPLIRVAGSGLFLPIAIVVIFGLMGLGLPLEQVKARIHAAIALLLIVLVTFWGTRRAVPVLHLYPFLYIVFVMRSCLMFRPQERITIAMAAFSLFLTAVFYRVQNSAWIENLGIRVPALVQERLQERLRLLNLGFAVTAALLMGLALLFIFLLVNALLAERQSREQVAIANQQLRQYALRVEALAMAQERNRIARDIHDSLGHSLTALNLQLEGALKLWQTHPDRAQAFLQEAKQTGSMALQEVRQSVSEMRADPLQGKSLEDAIGLLVQNFQRSSGIAPAARVDLPDTSLNLNITVYRIVQEALTNISRHAHATQVTLEIRPVFQSLAVFIQDDGQGFEWQQNQTGFGLQGMRERVTELGGELAIVSSRGQGCEIRVHLPLRKSDVGKPS
jgi:signal transduction histidine kinase